MSILKKIVFPSRKISEISMWNKSNPTLRLEKNTHNRCVMAIWQKNKHLQSASLHQSIPGELLKYCIKLLAMACECQCEASLQIKGEERVIAEGVHSHQKPEALHNTTSRIKNSQQLNVFVMNKKKRTVLHMFCWTATNATQLHPCELPNNESFKSFCYGFEGWQFLCGWDWSQCWQ